MRVISSVKRFSARQITLTLTLSRRERGPEANRIPWRLTFGLLVAGCASHPAATPPPPLPTPPVVVVEPVPQPAPLPAPAATQPTVDVEPRDTVPFLASDELAGRLPGTPGIVAAGEYLAGKLRDAGVPPAPALGGYFQSFPMLLSTALGDTRLAINGKPLVLNTDYAPLSITGEGAFRGPVVFAGYGTADSVHHYDDYANLNVIGKVVLALREEPQDENRRSRFATGNLNWSPAASLREKARRAAACGAVAMLVVSGSPAAAPDAVAPFSNPGGDAAPLPVIQVSRRVADLLLAMGEAPPLATLQHRIDTTVRPASMPLVDVSAGGTVGLDRHSATVRNVVAELPGTGPTADEIVVVGAHYDHLGRGQLGHMVPMPASAHSPANAIYHGADDNASGVAAVLEVAAQLRQAGPLPRSVLICFFTGEEEGLVGSDWFVKHPPVPLDHVVAMLNLDMVGRLRNENLLIGGWGTAAAFDGVVKQAIAGTPLHTQTFEKGGLGPSDHMSFAAQHIPVLFYFTDLHADYHRPTDTADKINYDGIQEVVAVARRTVEELASLPRQTYDARSDATATMAALTGHGGPRASLGVVPDFGSFGATTGVLLSGVGANSPASRAGLKPGDVLLRFNATPLNNLQDLADALDEAASGDHVTIQLLRAGKPLEVHATLGQRGGTN